MTSWRILCDRSVVECCIALAAWGPCAWQALRGERDRRVPLLLLATTLALLYVQPKFEQTFERPRPVAILVDDSASARRGGDDSPYRRAEILATDASERLRAQGVDVEFRTLSESLENRSIYLSPLYAPFGDPEPLDLARFSNVLFLTDGVPNPDLASPEVARRARPSLRVAVLGESSPVVDWRIAEFALPTSDVPTLRARVEAINVSSPRPFRARLWIRDETSRKVELLRDETLTPEKIEENRYAFELETPIESRDAPASFLFFVSDLEDDCDPITAPVDALRWPANRLEFCYANNGLAFRNDAKDSQFRVLLVDDEPRPEYRYLRETLRRERDVDLTACLLAADSPDARPPEFGLDAPDYLAQFDVVILGDLPPERLAKILVSLDELAESPRPPALWLTAPDASPNDAPDDASPDDESDWRLDPTPLAAQAFGAPSLAWRDAALTNVRLIEPAPGDAILLNAWRESTGARVPLLVGTRRGRLPVLTQATDEFWRLRALEDKAVYRRFVRGALDYLTASPRDPEGDVASPSARGATEIAAEARDAFEYYGRETAASRRAEISELAPGAPRVAELAALAEGTGGACLDLRDASADEQARRLAALTPPDIAADCEKVARTRSLCPPRLAAPVGVGLTLWILGLEARRRRRVG